MSRVTRKLRVLLASYGWRLISFAGSKGFCSMCMVRFRQGEMKWGYGGYLGHYHDRCLAGLFVYGPRVLNSVQASGSDSSNDELIVDFVPPDYGKGDEL